MRAACSSSIFKASASCSAFCWNSSLIVYSSSRTCNLPASKGKHGQLTLMVRVGVGILNLPVAKLCLLCSLRGAFSNRCLNSSIRASNCAQSLSTFTRRDSESASRSRCKLSSPSRSLNSAIVVFAEEFMSNVECQVVQMTRKSLVSMSSDPPYKASGSPRCRAS